MNLISDKSQIKISMNKAIMKASFFFYWLILLIGCNQNKKENLLIDKTLNINLMLSNERISQNTTSMIQTFRNYSDDPAASKITNPKLENMELVRKITSGTIEYFDELKRSLKIEAGLKLINLKETFEENNFNAVVSIFKNKKKGIEVYEHLIKYQTDIQQINPDLFVSLKNPDYFFDFFSIPKEQLETEFTSMYFDNINTISALAVLTKFENDVRIYENKGNYISVGTSVCPNSYIVTKIRQ